MNQDTLRKLLGKQRVLCVPNRLLRPLLQGADGLHYFPRDEKDKLTCIIGGILDNNLRPLPHCEAEADPKYRQVVVCVLVEDVQSGELLVTRKMNDQSGVRDAFSLCLNEHVLEGEDIYDARMRLLKDLVSIQDEDVLIDDFSGFLYGADTQHDSTHIGLVFHIGVLGSDAAKLQPGLNGEWYTLGKVARLYKSEALETWSQVVFEQEVLSYLAKSRDDSIRLQALETLEQIEELEKNGFLQIH